MPRSSKAPVPYRPHLQGAGPPPVYRPQQSGHARLQLRPIGPAPLEARSAPPVYRVQPAVAVKLPAFSGQGQSTLQTMKKQVAYEVSQPVWTGSGQQQLTIKVKGSTSSVGTVDIRYENGKAHLSDLEVVQSHRRQGAATELLKVALASARQNGSRTAELEAHPESASISPQALVGMYQRLGFKDTGRSARGNPVMVLQQKPR
jgi:ribosomal protein S18 acetylase RimI-like enzyme